MNGISTLIAAEGLLSNLLCDPDHCLSYVLVLLNILSVFYLIFSSYWRMTPRLKIVGYVWSAAVVCATVAIVAMHTCIFTLLCAVFTGLSLVAILSGVFNNGYNNNATEENPVAKVGSKKGCYVVFRTDDGKFVFGLYAKRKKQIATSIYKYDTLEQAKAAIQACREYGEFVEIEDNTGNWILTVRHPKLRVFAQNSAFVVEYALKQGLSILKTAALADVSAAIKQAQLMKECLTAIDIYFAGDEVKSGSAYLQSDDEMDKLKPPATVVTVEEKPAPVAVEPAPVAPVVAEPVYVQPVVETPIPAPVAPVAKETPVNVYAGVTLIENFEMMTPCSIAVDKRAISDYLAAKYGESVVVKNPIGADSFAFADTYSIVKNFNLQPFAMSYEKMDCGMLLLIRSDAAFITYLASAHEKINKSASPMASSRDWYSVVIDETYSAREVGVILDHAKAYVEKI